MARLEHTATPTLARAHRAPPSHHCPPGAQGALTSQRRQACHRAQTATGQVKARTRPGGTPVVFARDAVKRPFRLSRGRGPRPRLISHVLPPPLGASLEEVVGVFRGIVDPGRCERDPTFCEHGFAQGQRVQAGRRAAVPGVVENQLDNYQG